MGKLLLAAGITPPAAPAALASPCGEGLSGCRAAPGRRRGCPFQESCANGLESTCFPDGYDYFISCSKTEPKAICGTMSKAEAEVGRSWRILKRLKYPLQTSARAKPPSFLLPPLHTEAGAVTRMATTSNN